MEHAGLPQGSFQAISMVHVIEHLIDPAATLKTLHDLLAPGGRLLVVTPNVASLGHAIFGESWRELDPPRHLYLFSQESLIKTVETAGFRVKTIRTSSRTARGIWRESRVIAAGQSGNPHKPSKGKLWGRLFSLWESTRCLFSPVGEELLIVAEKPQD